MDYKPLMDKVLNMLLHADGNDPSDGHLTMDRWEWPTGVALYGIYKTWRQTGDEEKLNYLISWYDDQLNRPEQPHRNVNTVAPALALVCLYKLVFSPSLRFSAVESITFVVSMLCVGFLEELIFRGFLFRAIEKENLARAIVISSVTFGIGHIVNLLNGQDLLETVGQVIFAVFVGFALVILFHKGKSLVPCIVFHGVFNALSVVANDEALNRALGGPVLTTVIMIAFSAVLLGGYSVWNWKHLEG